MSKGSSTADLARFLADVKKNSGNHIHQPHFSIEQQIECASEPAAAVVASFLEDIKQNPMAYEALHKSLQRILLKEKKEVDKAIEDLMDLKFELEEEEDERVKRCNARELEWLNQDLQDAKLGILDAIQRKRESTPRYQNLPNAQDQASGS